MNFRPLNTGIRKLSSATVRGQTVKVGDVVGFKCDIEQHGRIVEIQSDGTSYGYGVMLVLENKNGFSGGYIGGQTVTTQAAADCWID